MKPGLLLFCCILPSAVWAQCSPVGPDNGAGFSSNTGVGSVSWVNSSNAQLSDNIPAAANVSIGLLSSVTTNYLTASGFGFSIPSTATICGIKVDIEKRYNILLGLLSAISDNSVKIIKGGVISGNNKASGSGWPSSDTYTPYGGSADGWGLSWSPADVNASDFGVAISVNVSSGLAALSLDALIDHIRITVYYNNTLPVTFRDFWGKEEPGKIKLNWSTASESNSSHFILEKMTGDGAGWKTIDSVLAAFNSVTDRYYAAYDHFPGEKNIYRVREVDRDGRSLYSKIISVLYHSGGKAVVTVYPNPAGRFITVEASQPIQSLHLLDLAGVERLVLKSDLSGNTVKIPLDQFKPGIYFLVTETAGQRSVQELVVHK